jgi:hypothetical protein
MQEFKSPVTRLARLFQKGRDNWKEKALEKQAKVRNLEIKVRDLENSRENCKARALAAEKKRSRALTPRHGNDPSNLDREISKEVQKQKSRIQTRGRSPRSSRIKD